MKLSAFAYPAAAGVFLACAAAASAQNGAATIFCDDTGFGCITMQPVVDRYNEEHPDLPVKLETVSYQAILESLPRPSAQGTRSGSASTNIIEPKINVTM